MAAVTEELALRYLLELSTDIRAALLLGSAGELLAAAPEQPDDATIERCAVLAREADALANGSGRPVELDVSVPDGAVFLVLEDERCLVCVTGPFALPGLILHDMRTVLHDLHRGAPTEPAR